MPARRRYYSRRATRPLKTVKYSNETFGFNVEKSNNDNNNWKTQSIVPTSDVGGMRKAKKFYDTCYN